jgi:hypothetical protein
MAARFAGVMTFRSARFVPTGPVTAVSAVATTWLMFPGVTGIARSTGSTGCARC